MRTESAAAGCKISGFVGVLSIAAAVTFGLCHAVQAQSPAPAAELNEVPLGTFTVRQQADGFSIVEPPEGVPESKQDSSDDGSGRWFFQGWQKAPSSDTAENLYNEARNALEGGRTDEAQGLFERLIAEAPGSARASEARMQLGRIYRGDVGNAAATETGALPAPEAREEGAAWADKAGGARAMSLNISRALPRSTINQARVSAALDGEFLSDAGDRVFFSAGSANLGIRARGVIQSQARFLAKYPELTVAVEGHSDDGMLPDAEIVRLAQERAAVVRDRLIAEGVEADRITAYGRGREERVSDCPAPECLAQNRRAVTVLLKGRVHFGERLDGRGFENEKASSGDPLAR
jgi:outer membrane protein OmpA-like peptidoglycan-associated protein